MTSKPKRNGSTQSHATPNIVVLREGNNGFTCMRGNPKAVGDPPMCADAAEWVRQRAELN